jgi:hypothetical protein
MHGVYHHFLSSHVKAKDLDSRMNFQFVIRQRKVASAGNVANSLPPPPPLTTHISHYEKITAVLGNQHWRSCG